MISVGLFASTETRGGVRGSTSHGDEHDRFHKVGVGRFTTRAERAEYDVVHRKVRSWEQRNDAQAAAGP